MSKKRIPQDKEQSYVLSSKSDEPSKNKVTLNNEFIVTFTQIFLRDK
jgi:hypothetical protein